MADNVKVAIANAAKEILMQEKAHRLTVTDIVNRCKITRQTFYYHFEDVPDLCRWMLKNDTKQFIQKAKNLESDEERLKFLFVIAINVLPYVKRGMESNYKSELEQILLQHIQSLFEHVCDEKDLYQDCTRYETRLILRYHSLAILGLLQNWQSEDTKNLDQIVHTVYRLMTDGISPLS